MKSSKSIKSAAAVLVAVFTIIATPLTVLAKTDVYTVQKGDSLWIIAKKYRVGISEIVGANPQFKDPNLIYPGDKVYVPLDDPELVSLEEQVVALVNKERAKQGLAPLAINWQVARVARYKANDMRDKKYFDHTSPTYGSPFDMLKKFNVAYRNAGENIAKGQKTAADVVRAWMNSEGHRKNIMSPTFTEIGVGYSAGNSTTYWAQLFIRP